MLAEARKFLLEEYCRNREIAAASPYYALYTDEKYRHSLQVLGAGNFIIRHEPWFADKKKDFIELAKTAVLLHDIARFDEIRQRFLGVQDKLDHSIMGWEMLRTMPAYDDVRITLPIKHHGHLIGDFYADEDVGAVGDPVLKKQVEKILFLIRDADKIANFNLMMYDETMLMPLFVSFIDQVKDQRQQISDGVLEDFWQHQPIDRRKIRTQADEMLGYIGWIFDLNYYSSVVFCKRLKLVDMMFDTLMRFHTDKALNEKMRGEISAFIQKRFGADLSLPLKVFESSYD